MQIAAILSFFAACSIAAPAWSAPAVASNLTPAPATAPQFDDFACMVRTMYVASAAETAAKSATSPAKRAHANKVSTENYESASFFIGKLSAAKPGFNPKQRYAAEISGLNKLDNTVLVDQIAQCVYRAQIERGAYLGLLAGR